MRATCYLPTAAAETPQTKRQKRLDVTFREDGGKSAVAQLVAAPLHWTNGGLGGNIKQRAAGGGRSKLHQR